MGKKIKHWWQEPDEWSMMQHRQRDIQRSENWVLFALFIAALVVAALGVLIKCNLIKHCNCGA